MASLEQYRTDVYGNERDDLSTCTTALYSNLCVIMLVTGSIPGIIEKVGDNRAAQMLDGAWCALGQVSRELADCLELLDNVD